MEEAGDYPWTQEACMPQVLRIVRPVDRVLPPDPVSRGLVVGRFGPNSAHVHVAVL